MPIQPGAFVRGELLHEQARTGLDEGRKGVLHRQEGRHDLETAAEAADELEGERLVGDEDADLAERAFRRRLYSAMDMSPCTRLRNSASRMMARPEALSRKSTWSCTQTLYAVLVGDMTTSWRSSVMTSYIHSTSVRSSLRQTALW